MWVNSRLDCMKKRQNSLWNTGTGFSTGAQSLGDKYTPPGINPQKSSCEAILVQCSKLEIISMWRFMLCFGIALFPG